jgi:L-cysteine desulfidase
MNSRDALRLLKSEIVQVVGCTEPAAVGYAFRTLSRHLPAMLEPCHHAPLELRISRDAHRNASTAVVPHLLQRGIRAAVAAGLTSRRNDFNVFADFDLPAARELLKRKRWVHIIPVRRRGLHISARIPSQQASLILETRHDHIRQFIIGDRNLTPNPVSLPPPPGLDEIWALAQRRSPKIEALALDFIIRQVAAESGYPLAEQIARRVSGRMSGYSHPVMTLTGSGNQGIFIGLPYRQLYQEKGEAILPSLVFSLFVQLHLSHRHKRLSGDCGLATKAAPSLAAGIAFSQGATLPEIRRLLREIPTRLLPMRCPGACPSCGMKAEQCLEIVQILT